MTRDTLGAARSWLDAHALEAAAAHLARIDGAAGAAGEEARATLAWLRPLLAEAASPIDVVDGGRLAPELKLRVPEAVARDRDGVGALRVDAFAGAGAVAVLPVRYAGGRVTIALELETEHAEIGAGLDVALRRPGEGEAALQLSFGVSGGGLVSDRVMGCDPWIDRAAPVWQQPTGPVDGLTHVTYELDFMPDPGGTRCVVRDVAGAVTRVDRHYRSRALPPGDYELVIRAGPPVPWDTVMWSRLTLRRLVVGGLTVRSVAPGPLERANRALYDGALTTADELHAAAGDVFGRLLVALRRHDGAAAAELVRALGEAAWTTAAGRGGRLLRVDPEATAPLVAGLGRGVLARAFARAWDVARRYVGDPLAQRGLLVPALDALTGRDGDELGLVASRMRLLLEGRDAARAYAIGERALSEADVAGGPAEEVAPLVAEIELLCAWGAHQLGDVVSARRHLERWLSAAPVREPALETLANQPEFAPLLGYLDP